MSSSQATLAEHSRLTRSDSERSWQKLLSVTPVRIQGPDRGQILSIRQGEQPWVRLDLITTTERSQGRQLHYCEAPSWSDLIAKMLARETY